MDAGVRENELCIQGDGDSDISSSTPDLISFEVLRTLLSAQMSMYSAFRVAIRFAPIVVVEWNEYTGDNYEYYFWIHRSPQKHLDHIYVYLMTPSKSSIPPEILIFRKWRTFLVVLLQKVSSKKSWHFALARGYQFRMSHWIFRSWWDTYRRQIQS